MNSDGGIALLEVKAVSKTFVLESGGGFLKKPLVNALDRVSFSIEAGKTLGLVGESGSGKTTTGRAVIRLLKPDSGEIWFEGQNILAMDRKSFRAVQPRIQMVFQDPYTTLNPRLTIREIVQEPMKINRHLVREDIEERTEKLMDAVGLKPNQMDRLPSEFSGGQRQRIAICRALSLNPRLIVCDEAVSALDVSIQAKIINLLMQIQEEFSPAYLFISHDLNVVRLISDTIAVMYLGKIVEVGPAEDLTDRPQHPYTVSLLNSVPDPYHRSKIRSPKGEIPGNIDLPTGCRFHTRCPHAMPRCRREPPALHEISPGRKVACFLHHDVLEEGRPKRSS